MKRLISLMSVFSLFSLSPIGTAAAQEGATPQAPRSRDARPARYDGALLFQLEGITGAPSAVDGFGLGGRYRINPKLLLRGGLALSTSNTEVKTGENTADVSRSHFGFEAGVEFILKQNRHIQLYVGPLLRVDTMSEELGEPEGEKSEGMGILFAGALGANWFFTPHVSLGAEYRVGYASRTTETGETEETTSNIGVTSVGLILSLWI